MSTSAADNYQVKPSVHLRHPTYLQSYDWLFFFAFFSLISIPYWSTTKDDTFIFLQVAKNIVQYGKFAFYPARAIDPITSHLWLLFVIIATKLARYVSPYVLLRIFNLVCIFGTFFMYSKLIKKVVADYKMQFLCLVLFSIDPQLMRWSFVGMETPLAVLLLLTYCFLFYDQIKTGKINFWLPLVILAGCLTRPEFLLAAVIWGVYGICVLFTQTGKEEKAKDLIGLSFFSIGYAAYLLWQKIQFGSAWASSVHTKGIASSFIAGWFMKYVSSWGGAYGLHYTLLICGIILVLKKIKVKKIADTNMRNGYRFEICPHSAEVFFLLNLLVWVFGVPLCYFLRGVFMTDRYTVISGPLVIFTLVFLLQSAFPLSPQALFSSYKKITIPLVIFLFLHSAALTCLVQLPTAKIYTAKDYALERMGRWLKANTNPSDKVFFVDVGVLGFFSERDIIDFLLVYPPLAAGEKVADALRKTGCSYYVFRGSSDREIEDRRKEYSINNDRSFETVLKFTIKSEGMVFGLREAKEMILILARVRYHTKT